MMEVHQGPPVLQWTLATRPGSQPAGRPLGTTVPLVNLGVIVNPKAGISGTHDQELVARLREGDEAAFRELVSQFQGRLTRLARSFCRNDSVIEEAVQETWLAVIKGIKGFEGRAPLQSWIFSILVNHARKLAVREQRHARAGEGVTSPGTPGEAAEDAYEHEPGMGPRGHWENPPTPWGLENPESVLLRQETLRVIEQALDGMPEAQRRVVLLRDVEGLAAEEVCNILEVSGTNQRVLLHRGRARVRRALDAYLRVGSTSPTPVRRQKAGAT